MVGERGFEPPASRSRTVRSAVLSYSPASCDMLSCPFHLDKPPHFLIRAAAKVRQR